MRDTTQSATPQHRIDTLNRLTMIVVRSDGLKGVRAKQTGTLRTQRKDEPMARCSKLALLMAVLLQSGCATGSQSRPEYLDLYYPHVYGETMALTPAEHRHAVEENAKHDARALVEDLDLFFLTDRPTRLTRWPTR